jgi:autotransporter-associated beta strand protein
VQVNQGTLSLTAANVMPTFGNLNAVTGSVVTIQPGATVLLNNNNQEFGNLAGINPGAEFQFSGGVLNLGTATLVVGREGSNQTFGGQIIGVAGSVLQKIGGGTLTLSNYNGNMPNSLDILRIDQGTISSRNNDQSWATPTAYASAIPSTTDVYLRGGTWQVRTIGDSTTNFQTIILGNDVFHSGGDSSISTVRDQGGASNKIVVFNNLSLDKQRFLVTGDNANYPRFDGTITLTANARIQTDAPLLLKGAITGNFSMEKRGVSNLEIGGDNSAWNGGIVATDGFILFGTRAPEDTARYMAGTTLFAPSATANAGTGDIVINRATAIRLNAPSNVLTAQGQRVQVFANDTVNSSRIDLALDAPLTSYGLRSTTNGTLGLNLNEGLWTSTIDQSKMGNGKWGISAVSNTFYDAATLGAGADNVFRFIGNSGATLSITRSGALSGTASVEVGRSHVVAGQNPGFTEAVVRFYGNQTYTGATNIFREADAGSINAVLELTGDSASSTFNVYGRLTLRGDGRVTNDAGAQVNTVNLMPGGNLRLDYNMDVFDSYFISRLENSNLGLGSDEDKWGDNQAMTLDGAGLNLINHSGRVNTETVGQITIKGGAGITLERNGGNGQMILKTLGITRDGQATLAIRPTSGAAELGSINLQSAKLFITGTAPTVTNGIVAPWMIDYTSQQFLNYTAENGFVDAAFTGTGTGDGFLSGLSSTSIAQYTAGDATLGGTRNVYALRVNHEAASNDTTWTGGQINIHSGGLITDNRDNARVNFDTTNVYFGTGSAATEGIIYVDENNTRIGGVVTAANLTINGPGGLHLTNTGNAISGTIQVNGGILYLDGNGTRGTANNIILHADYFNNTNAGQMPNLRLRHNSATTTYTGLTVTVAGNVPVAGIGGERFSGTGTTNVVEFGSLNVIGTNGPAGTLLNLTNSNSNVTVLGASTFGGSSAIAINVNANTWQFNGAITGSAAISKWGDGVLRLDGNNDATFSSAITLNRGELRITGPNAAGSASQAEGTGALRINFGTLRLAAQNTTTTNSTTTFFSSANQHVTVAGRTSIVYDRNGGTPASGSNGATIGAAGLEFRTENSPVVLFDPVSFGDHLRINSELVIRDQPFFRTPDANLIINNVIRGNGTLTKGDSWFITFDNNAANTNWTGGFTALQGYSRVTTARTNFTFGTGAVNVGPTAALSLNTTTAIAGGAVTNFSSGFTTPVVLAVSQASLFTTANLNTLFPAANNTSRSGAGGMLALDATGSVSTAFNQATFQDGYWSLGAVFNAATYTGDAGSLLPGLGNVYRINGVAGLTIDPLTAGSKLFTGANQVLYGKADAWHSSGYNSTLATLANDLDADYTGGTTIARGRDIGGGWYQGAVLVNGGNPTASTYRSPLGTGQVDVYGHLRFASANGGMVNALGANYAQIVTHAGGRITFDNRTAFVNAAGEGRYDDQADLTLNSAHLQVRGTSNVNTAATNRETINDLIVYGGSHIRLDREGNGFAGLAVRDIVRGTADNRYGTLTINHNTGLLGANTAAGGVNDTEVVWLTAAGPGTIAMTNNMVDPWIVSRNADQFLKYNTTNGLQLITQGTSPSNRLEPAAAVSTLDNSIFTGGNLNDGSVILDLGLATGTQTLGANLDVHALRYLRDINVSADGQFNRITIRSGGIILSGNNAGTLNPDLYFGSAGDGTGEALIFARQNVAQINGRIYASQVTKFGSNFLNIRSDQTQFSGNWVINEGGLQFLTPDSVGSGTNEIILNGSVLSDDDDRQDGGASLLFTELRYNFNSGSPDLFTWNHGKITSWDSNLIRTVTASDRNQLIPGIDLKTTATTPGGLHPGLIRFHVDGARSTLHTGTVTLFDHYNINVDATSYSTPGSTVGVQLGALDNQGLYDVVKAGDGVLALADNSASFDGTRFLYVDEGAVRALHNGAFGAAGNTAVVSQGGALEIAVAGFSPLATLDMRPGSIERWAVDGARSGPAVTMGSGVHLQIFHNQTGTKTINLNGGSLMGYLPVDYDHVGVIHSLGSNISIALQANSFLGQPFPAAETVIYDMGKQNSIMGGNPNDLALRGSYLQIDGVISGGFGLTKIGQDVILLNGANTYTGATTVKNGILQIGRNNSLNTSSTLVMDGSAGQFDLNGYNQEVAALSGAAGSINNGAFDYNTLTVNQTSNTTYRGTLDGNVTLAKSGAGSLTLTGANTHRGGTTVNAGTLLLASGSTLGWTNAAVNANGGTLDLGGTSQTVGAVTFAGGTITNGTLTGSAYNAQSGSASAVLAGSAGLTKTTGGVFTLSGANTFTGGITIEAGELNLGGSTQGGGALVLKGGSITNGTLVATSYDLRNGTISAALTGAVGITKTTDGFVVIGGANTYSGTTSIQQGVLVLGSSAALPGFPTPAAINVSNGAFLSFRAGGVGEWSAANINTVIGVANFNTSGGIGFDVTGSNEFTYSSTITGGKPVLKTGAGTLILSGSSTHTGPTVVYEGTLKVGSDDNTIFGTGNVHVAGGTLDLNGFDLRVGDLGLGGGEAGSAAVISIGTNLLTLGGNVTYSSDNNPLGAVINSAVSDCAMSLGGMTRYFVVEDSTGAAADLTVNARIIDGVAPAGIVKLGNGTLVLAGHNTFSGPVSAHGGVLSVSSAANLGTSASLNLAATLQVTGTSAVTLNKNILLTGNATLDITNSVGVTATGQIFGGSNITKTGAGNLTLAGANLFAGTTTVSGAGNLILGHRDALQFSTLNSSTNVDFSSTAGGVFTLGGLTGNTNMVLEDTASGAMTLQVVGNGTTYTGVLSGPGGLTKLGQNSTLNPTVITNTSFTIGAAQTYTGATTLAGSVTAPVGTGNAANALILDFANAAAPASNLISSSSALVFGGSSHTNGGTLQLNGKASTVNSQTFASTLVDQGSSFIYLNQGTATSLSLALGAITRNAGGTLDFALPAAGTVSASGTLTNGILGAWATVSPAATAGGGTNWATISAGNIVAYTGYTDITTTGTTLANNPANNVRITAGATATTTNLGAGTTDINSLLIAATNTAVATINIGANNTLRFGAVGGILLANGAGGAQIGTPIGAATTTTYVGTVGTEYVAANTGSITAGGAPNTAGELIFTNSTPSATSTQVLTINAPIVDNGTGVVSVTYSGWGQKHVFGRNTYTGGTVIDLGRVYVRTNSSAFGAGAVTVKAGGQVFAQDTILANNFQLSSAATSEGAGLGGLRLDNAIATGTITLVNDAQISSGTTGIVTGQITGSGALLKLGNGTTVLTNATNNYTGGTVVTGGTMLVRGAGVLGANAAGNDVFVSGANTAYGALTLHSASSVGSNQRVILGLAPLADLNNAVALGFGAGYGEGSGIRFHSLEESTGTALGGNNIYLTSSMPGLAGRLAIHLSGNSNFSKDIAAEIAAISPNTQVWLGANLGNGVFTGSAFSATNGALRLGAGGGTLTIKNANVLSGNVPLVVGATDQTARTNVGGIVYIPQAQNYSGSVTVGSGGVLQVGSNAALSTGNNTIYLMGGELRLDTASGAWNQTDTQYAARNLEVVAGNAVVRVTSLMGGSYNRAALNNITMYDADRVLAVSTVGTVFNELAVNNIVFNNNTGAAINQFLDVGVDNSFQTGVGVLTVNGVISQAGPYAVNLQKRQGGVLILNSDNTYDGTTNIQQGRLVLTHAGAAGDSGSTINFNTNGDRRSDLEIRFNTAGPFVLDNVLATSGGNDNSTRVIKVGPTGIGSENKTVQMSTLTIGHGGTFGLDSGASSSIYFDGYNGYKIDITGGIVLNRDINLRTRGAMVTVSGIISGDAANDLNKHEQGTLWLSGNNTYAGVSYISNGYLVAAHDNALGAATSAVTFRGGSFSQLLASGARTITRNFDNTGTGSTQTLGGLDAGAKLFSGNIAFTGRGMNLMAVTGGDVTFSGVISGAGATGITKVGTGTVILNPGTGTGNSFTGGVNVTNGTLVGVAQATSGSPFGGAATAFTVANGTLRLNGAAGSTNTSTTGALTINTGNAALIVDNTGGTSTQFTFGSLARSNAATLTLKGITTNLGTAGNEKISFTSAPALLNDMIGTWAVIQGLGTDNSGHYATMSGVNVITHTYDTTGDIGGSVTSATTTHDAGGVASTLVGNQSVFALRSNVAVSLDTFTLNLGAANAGTLGQAGLILNAGADIGGNAGSRLNFGTNVLSIYTDDAAVSAISAPVTNFRNNASNTLATVLVKYGPGTLELSGDNTFQGNVQVNQGTLSLTAANVMPTFGNLNAVTGSVVTIRPGATVLLNNNNQEFGNLSGTTVINAVQNTGGTLNLGTATLVVGREGNNQTFSGQIIGGATSKITKIGGGRLTLDNWDTLVPNSLGTLDVAQGFVESLANDQSWASPTGFASSIPSSTTILLRGGEWEVRAIGDNTGDAQRINIGNNIIQTGGGSFLDVNRPAFAGGSNKLLTFGTLSMDVQFMGFTGGNTYIPRFDGLATLTNHVRVHTDAQVVLAGGITDNGKGYTLTKTGASDLTIAGDNTSTWSGGMVISGGTVLFGTRGSDDILYPGVTFVPSSTANAGTGDIVLNQAYSVTGATTALRLNAPGNVVAGQDVLVLGTEKNWTTRVDIGADAALTSYNLRSTTNSALALGIGDTGLYTQALNQSMMGSGKWSLSAYATTYYMADTLGAGVDNVVRFGGTTSTLSIVNSNVITGGDSVEVGRGPIDFGSGTPVNTAATIRLYGTQDYTGNTTVFRSADFGSTGSYLEITGSVASSTIDVYGRLALRGAGRVTDDAGLTNTNAVNLRPGSALRLDYSYDVNDQFVVSRLNNSNLAFSNKWGDNTAMILDGAGLNLVAESQNYTQETIGQVTVKGGAGIFLERNSTNGGIVLITNSGIVRSGQATLAIRENADELGLNQFQSQRFYINDSAWITANSGNGILDPWMFNATRGTFLAYNELTGITNAVWTGTGTGDAFLAGLTSTSIAQYTAGDAILGGTRNVYALRMNHEAASNDSTISGTGQINIHSGGLFIDNRDNARVDFGTTAAVYFGDGTAPTEGVIYVDENSLRFQGSVTAAGLTTSGPGAVHIASQNNSGITGTVQVNSGILFLDWAGTGAGPVGSATIRLHGDHLNNNNGAQMAILALRTDSASRTYNNSVIISQNVPLSRIDTNRYSGTGSGNITIQNLTIEGTSGPAGTLLQIQNNNSYNLIVGGTTTIQGTSQVGIHVNGGTAQLTGAVTGSAGITKTGNGVLRLDANNTALSSQITLNRGEVRLQGTGTGTVPNNAVGTGDFISNFGTIRLASSVADHDFFVTTNQKIYINGLTLITLDRNGGGATNKYLGDDNDGQKIITSNSPYLIVNGSDALVIEAGLVINDILNLRTDTTTYLREKIEGNGRLVKIGNGFLVLDSYNAAHTFTGGFDVISGVTLLNAGSLTTGTGGVRLFAGAYLDMQNVGNLGAGGLTRVVTSDSALPTIGFRVVGNLATISATAATAGVTKGNGYGILALAANLTLSADPLMATRDGGFYNNWFLGGGNGNGNLTANSVTPWGTGGAEFRLGGGSGGTLTVNPATAGAQFAGANRMLLGAGMNLQAYGVVTFGNNSNNTYSGGTLLTRTRNYDNSYRGFVLNLEGGNNGTRTPLGSGVVDVFGQVNIQGATGTAVGSGGNNANAWTLHPSTRLRFDYGTPYTGTNPDGRWGDTAAIFLNGGSLEMLGDDAAVVASSIQYTETVGAVTAALGADISVVSRGTNLFAQLTLADLIRDTASSGTLTLRHNTGRLGVAGSVNADRLIVTAWAGGSPLMNNGMIDPWIVSRSEHQFLKYDTTTGFQLVTAGGAPANYRTFAGGTLSGTTLTANNGTEILDLTTATTTLGINADVHALRLDRDINVSADGLFNRITIRSGGLLLGSSQTPTINPDLYFGSSGLGDGEALISTSVNTLQINGRIFASQVTKSGLNFLNIRGDQTQFAGNWVIQDGGIQFLTPDSTGNGSNQIILGGGHMNDNDNYLQTSYSEARFNFNPGTPDLFTWNSGTITSYDIGRIYTVTATDRLTQIADIDLRTTNAVAGAGQEGLLVFQVDGSRSFTRTGTVTLHDHYQLWVESGSFGPGATTGLQLGSGTGAGGVSNQGLYDFRKVGDGMLILGDNSSTFTTLSGSNRTFTISEGGVRVTHNGAFGNNTVNAVISPIAALEIAVSNWVPTANLTQAWGSIERWAVSDARGTGNYTLPEGVHLQVFADLTGTRTININGGAIMGYLPLDYDKVAVVQTIRSGVTINLTANSFLGQVYPAGVSSGQNSLFYDMGVLNTTTNLNPNDIGLRGSYLQIDGNITGAGFTLTKTGQDIIKLSGTANTYGGTTVENGILQIGANNVLPVGGTLTTKFSGMFDLNGYNQEVAGLAGDGGSINNGAFENKTLTVNQAANTTYGGQVNGNVTFRKKGAGKLIFTAVNSHRGGTEIEGGTLSIAQASSLGYSINDFRAAALRFMGGILEVTANTTLGATNGVTVDAGGGTIATTSGVTFTIASPITGTGDLTKTETGTLALTGTGSDLSGNTNVNAGTLLGGAANVFSALSRVVLTGDTVSGTLNLGGFNQTIGSLASTGAVQGNASVTLGSSTLTVGGDDTSDAVYAGAVTGGGVFRISTHGAQTLSTVDHSAQAWSTEIANGRLSVAGDGKLGSGNITLGVATVTGMDDMTVLDLQGVSLANNVIVNNANSAGVSVIQSTVADSALTGNVSLNRDTFVGVQALTGLVLGGANVVSGTGRITMVDGGNLLLSGNNTYGTSVSGSAGALIDGGTVVRSGRIELSHSSALGSKHVELGDTRTVMSTIIDRATTASLTAGGGVFDAAGGSAQSGSFTGVSSTVDSHTYLVGDVGKTILVKNEEANPTRNGIYTIVSVSGGTMNLVRHVEFDAPSEMTYGTQFAVVNGSSAGKHFFMMQNDADECCLPVENPIRFREELASNNVALVITTDALNVTNAIDVNATAGTGSITIGGDESMTTGAATFSGNVVLQNLQVGAAGIETKTVILTSETDGSSSGITFSGVISEADSANDTLSIEKTGNGTVTLAGVNTYHGTTYVTDGTLQLGTGGSVNDTTFIRIDSGATFGTAVGGYTTDATIAGSGSIAGNLTVGSNVGSINTTGVIKPGDSTGGLLANAGDQLGTLTVNGNLTLASGAARLELQLGNALVADYNASAEIFTRLGNGTFDAWVVDNTDGHLTLWEAGTGSHDRINGTGTLTLTGGGTVSLLNPGSYSIAHGDVFDLMDWSSITLGTFDLGGAYRAGGALGDLVLPTLDPFLAWNTTLFQSHGILVVVPEPSRMLLLMFGLLALFFRRRRRNGV